MHLARAVAAERIEEFRGLLGPLALELLEQVANDRSLGDPREPVVGEVDGRARVERDDVEPQDALGGFGAQRGPPTWPPL